MSGRNAKWLIGLLGVLALAVSLAANVWLARGLRARYASQLEQQVWPPGPPTEPRISGDAGPTVLLVGDSRVAEWPAPVSPGVRWVNAGSVA